MCVLPSGRTLVTTPDVPLNPLVTFRNAGGRYGYVARCPRECLVSKVSITADVGGQIGVWRAGLWQAEAVID